MNGARDATLRVDEIRSTDALRALEDEWRALWRACPQASVFQTPEWLLPWWEVFGEGELRTVAIRRGERLVGLAPLYIYVQPASGERTVLPLGVSISDHLDLLLLPDVADAAAPLVLEYLRDIADEWDACDLDALPEGAAILRSRVPDELHATAAESDGHTVLPLPPTVDGLREVVPARMLDNVRYYTRRAARRGSLAFERAHAEGVCDALDALLALHGARWRSRGEDGVLADDAVQRFHRIAAPRLYAAELLRLHVMRLDRRIAAVCYWFLDGRRASLYLTGFDPELEAISPGTLILHHAAVQAIGDGAVELDMLRGRERYKYLWGARDRPSFRRRLVHAASVADVGA